MIYPADGTAHPKFSCIPAELVPQGSWFRKKWVTEQLVMIRAIPTQLTCVQDKQVIVAVSSLGPDDLAGLSWLL